MGGLQPVQRTSDARNSVANCAHRVNGRSQDHPCWYQVGTINRDAVYWHPYCGFAREKEHSYLVELAALSGVVWEPSQELIDACYESRGRLMEAMGVDLREAVIDTIRYAVQCAAELANEYETTRGVHVALTEVF